MTLNPLRARIVHGIRDGLIGAGGLTAVALIVVGIASPEPGELPAPLWAFILLYFAGGLLGGAVFGALRPLRNTLLGTFVFLFCLLSVLVGLLWVSIAFFVAGPVDPWWVVTFTFGTAAALALVFTPILWGKHRGASWAGSVAIVVFVSALLVRNSLEYQQLHAGAGFWRALLHQWPVLILVAVIGLVKFLIDRRARPRLP